MNNGVCSFTGHRIIKKEHESGLSGLLMRAIEYAYTAGCRRFLSGGAIGFDTWAARAVISYREAHPDVKLILVLPCKNQSERWSLEDIREHERLISLADEVTYVSDVYTDTCMRKRNMMLADEADMLIAYVSRLNSGTAQTVRMAKGKEIYNLYYALEKRENKKNV
jgi:uncharacterized phage-like protein YoqJ